MSLQRLSSGHYRRSSHQTSTVCFISPQETCSFPPVVTYDQIRLQAGHYRRVLREGNAEPLALLPQSKAPSRAPGQRLGPRASPTTQGNLDKSLAEVLQSSGYSSEGCCNCDLFIPLCTSGFGCCEDDGFGLVLNNDPLCGSLPIRQRRINILIEATTTLQQNLETLEKHLKDAESKCSAQELQINSLNEASARLDSEKQDLALQVAAQVATAKQLESELAALQPLEEEMRKINEEHAVKDAKLKELSYQLDLQEQKIRTAQTIASQTAKTYFAMRRSQTYRHGLEVIAILQDNTSKVIRLRIEYELRCLALARNRRLRLLPLRLLHYLLHTEEDLNLAVTQNIINPLQAQPAAQRVALVGYSMPLVLEFPSTALKDEFVQQIFLVLDSVHAESERIDQKLFEEEAREKRYDLFRGKEEEREKREEGEEGQEGEEGKEGEEGEEGEERRIEKPRVSLDKARATESGFVTKSDIAVEYLLKSPRGSSSTL